MTAWIVVTITTVLVYIRLITPLLLLLLLLSLSLLASTIAPIANVDGYNRSKTPNHVSNLVSALDYLF